MKTLTLHQPWASLVVLGHKRLETRGWPVPPDVVGRRIGVHAAKTSAHMDRCHDDPFCRFVPDPDELPCAALLGTVLVVRCRPITRESGERLRRENPVEHAFGDYDVSDPDAPRWAWTLDEPAQLPLAVPYVGHQKLFEVDDALLGEDPWQERLL